MDIAINEISHYLASALKPIERVNGEKLKLIIHAGTPKTGTTSIQTYLEKKQGKLRRKGVLYPHNLEKITNSYAPKHQWFEKNLTTMHLNNFLENIKNIAAQVEESTHTIILSSEGIFNYWWDFTDDSKFVLRELNKHFEVQVWVWFREPLAFIESYYKQCIRNPQIESNPCYGKDLSFAQMLDIKWFSNHLNYQGFVSDCEVLFGKDSVEVFDYEQDVVQRLIQKLGLATAHDNPTARQNNSLHSRTIALLRVINQHDIKIKDRELLIPHLKNMNEVFERYAEDTLIDDTCREKIVALYHAVEI